MAKVTTTVTVDPELREKAKKLGLNLSEVFEKAIQEALEGPARRPELPNYCLCGHGRSRHIAVSGADSFVIYKCYECLRWCTTGNLNLREGRPPEARL